MSSTIYVERFRNIMQTVKVVLIQKWSWVRENKPFWAHLLFAFLTVVVVAVRPAEVDGKPTDLPVRFWGMCLQLIGAYFVWRDLTTTAEGFGVQSRTVEWLKRLFRIDQPVSVSVSIDCGCDVMNRPGFCRGSIV